MVGSLKKTIAGEANEENQHDAIAYSHCKILINFSIFRPLGEKSFYAYMALTPQFDSIVHSKDVVDTSGKALIDWQR
jgi:hypothetical protein